VLAPRFAFANRAALAAVALATGLQLVAAFFQPLARVLGVTPLSAREWVLVGALGALPAVIGQTAKLIRALSASARERSAHADR
jgi:hypothetical protein